MFFTSPDRADFHITSDRKFANGAEPPGAVLRTIKEYNNTVLTITAPGLDAGGPAALADKYRAEYRAITSGELLAEGNPAARLRHRADSDGAIRAGRGAALAGGVCAGAVGAGRARRPAAGETPPAAGALRRPGVLE